MTEETQAQEETMETTETTQAPVATLGLNDLALMANVIQVTADRGAIKANEMTAVGSLYSKIVSFVNANVPQPVAEDAESINEADVETNESSEEE